MGYRLDKLVMHNFKLFSNTEIDVNKESLIILDGPNGYGKTSTFDAIEYLFTGNIKRVSENGISKSNIGFDEDCLIKNPSDGTETFVEGIFCDEENNQVKIKRILSKGNGVANNPSKIISRTKTSISYNEEIICEGKSVKESNKVLEKYMGAIILNYYNQFFYVSQEDRLQFLSYSENDRIKEIQKLFGIQEEEENFKKIEKILKVFQTLKKSYLQDMEKENNKIQELEGEIREKSGEIDIKYKDLMRNERNSSIWNQRYPQIENKEKLLEIIERIKAVSMFSREIQEFWNDKKNQWINTVSNNREELKKYLYLNSYESDLNSLKEKIAEYIEIVEILDCAKTENGSFDYEKYNYKKLEKILNIKVNIEEIEDIKKDIKIYRQNVKDEDTARTSIIRLQKSIKKEWEVWQSKGYEGFSDNQCPLCGQYYDDKLKVIQALDTYREVIEKGKGDFEKLIDDKISKLERIYNLYYKDKVEKYLEANKHYKNNIFKQIYDDWDSTLRNYRMFMAEGNNYGIFIDSKITEEELDKADECVTQFIIALERNKSELSDEYYEHKERYRYAQIFSLEYNNQKEKVYFISEADMNKKIQYIEQEYYGNKQNELLDTKIKLEKLQIRVNKMKAVETKIRVVRDKVKTELKKYKEELVNTLQTPFYLYTGRILQNYPGGLGILMNIVQGEKIRFEAERRSGHDVLYTLSSGQLSAIAISIALTLNKVYAQDSMRCMLIDDPIQTMDELNIASFVEVLRTDFADYQFILSTHEEDFTDYICYKYEKYGLSNCSISIRDL